MQDKKGGNDTGIKSNFSTMCGYNQRAISMSLDVPRH